MLTQSLKKFTRSWSTSHEYDNDHIEKPKS